LATSAFDNEKTTSAKPPVLTNGSDSLATINIRIEVPLIEVNPYYNNNKSIFTREAVKSKRIMKINPKGKRQPM
jgi:hypothetical protein